MTMVPGLNPGGWQVGTQVPASIVGGDGRLVHGTTVHFVTAYGVSSSVFVPDKTLTPDRVNAMIRNKVATLDAIQQGTPGQAGK